MTSRRTSSVRLIAALLAAVFILCADTAGTQPAQKYKKNVYFGLTDLQLDNGCVSLLAYLSAGKFFDHLQRTGTSTAVEFRRENTLLTTFPDIVYVTLKGWDFRTSPRCQGPFARRLKAIDEARLMSSLRFRVGWLTGSGFQEARDVSSTLRSGTASWIYVLSIPSHNIPLTSKLTMTILAEDDREVASFAASL